MYTYIPPYKTLFPDESDEPHVRQFNGVLASIKTVNQAVQATGGTSF